MPSDVAEFACSICGAFAMRVRLVASGGPMTRERDVPGFVAIRSRSTGVRIELPTSDTWLAVSEMRGSDRLAEAIANADAATMASIYSATVPYWCLKCQAVFCETHWTIWEEFEPGTGWSEGHYGRCPNGHRRSLD